MPVISTAQFRNGLALKLDGQTFTLVEFQHVKPGKGGAFVRTKVKRLSDGAVIERTFRAGEKFESSEIRTKLHQYLYTNGEHVVVMDPETYEQIELPAALLGDDMGFLAPNGDLEVLFVDGAPQDLTLPNFVELTVTSTEPGVKGDTVQGVTKPATLETGGVVQVPIFVNEGDRLKIDTRQRSYVTRVTS